MAINLVKGQRINLEKNGGEKMTQFCIGCNWGQIEAKGFLGILSSKKDVDLDLSCIMTDSVGQVCDHIYSPLYKKEFLARYGFPTGKLDSKDGALHHTGDDLKGDSVDDGMDNEIITVQLDRVNPNVSQIFFFLNNVGEEDFSQIPYARIRMFEGTPSRVKSVFATFDVASDRQYVGCRAAIMGKLYRHGGEWKFAAIGDPTKDKNLCESMINILKNYAK